jgi:putative transposase
MSTYARSSQPVLRRSIEPGQYLSVRYADRLADNDIVASVGSRGDSYDRDDAGALLRSA